MRPQHLNQRVGMQAVDTRQTQFLGAIGSVYEAFDRGELGRREVAPVSVSLISKAWSQLTGTAYDEIKRDLSGNVG